MATLTVRNLDEHVVRRLRIRAAEAEHRNIPRRVQMDDDEQQQRREQTTARLADFRRRTAGRGSPSAADLLAEARAARTGALTAPDDGA